MVNKKPLRAVAPTLSLEHYGDTFRLDFAYTIILESVSLNSSTETVGLGTATSATNPSLQGLAFNALRPNITGYVLVSTGSKADRIRRYFNAPAFAPPAPYIFGNVPPTRYRGWYCTDWRLCR